MKSFRHWTPIYIFNRINEMIYRMRYPDHPWLTQKANSIIETILKKDDIGLEFGSGRSTLWFSRRVSYLTSIEHDINWFNSVNYVIKNENICNINLIYAPEETFLIDVRNSKYVKIVDSFDKESLDFVLLDGIYRSACANAVLQKIKPGGILIIDNVNLYLPSKSISPASRSIIQGPRNKNWAGFLDSVNKWRRIWTTSGVSDTAFFIKPCEILC